MDGGSAFQFVKAVRQQTWVIMALAGPSGGGKTWTALELATGLAADGKIALISTEGSRDLYYADYFDFDRVGLEAPYTPERWLAAMKAAQAAGYRVIINDSFSDEYIGEGGLADMAAAERVPNEAAKWAKPKAEHKKVIRWIRNGARCHLIFAMRAEEKVRLIKNEKGQTVVEPIGYQPICEKSFMYDMMESALLLPEKRDKDGKIILADARGVPQWIKPMSQHLAFFPENKPITRESGRLLAEWCAGGVSAPARDLRADAEAAAAGGDAAFRSFYFALTDDEKLALRPRVKVLQAKARAADAKPKEPINDLAQDPPTESTTASEPDFVPERDSDFWGQDRLIIARGPMSPGEFEHAFKRYLRQALDKVDLQALEADNADMIESLPRATREEVAAAIRASAAELAERAA
jgi:hypothetical protein